jgi:hypothetical protein
MTRRRRYSTDGFFLLRTSTYIHKTAARCHVSVLNDAILPLQYAVSIKEHNRKHAGGNDGSPNAA